MRQKTYDIEGILPNGLMILRETSPEDYEAACRMLEEAEQEQEEGGSLFEDDPMVDDRK